MRPRDHVDRDHLANIPGRLGSGFRRRLHGADVALDEHGDEPGPDLLTPDDGDVRRLDHGVRGSKGRNVALRLDEPDGVAHVVSPLSALSYSDLASDPARARGRAGEGARGMSRMPMTRASTTALESLNQPLATEPCVTSTRSP